MLAGGREPQVKRIIRNPIRSVPRGRPESPWSIALTTDADPIIGNWYQHLDKRQKFTVVALDTDKKIIEIPHFDGDVEEIDLDEWHELEIEASTPSSSGELPARAH